MNDPKLPEKYKVKWRKGNEERMLDALVRFGHLQMRVKFELLEEDGNGRVKYGTILGRTLVFKRIATQGCLLSIVEALSRAGEKEAQAWTRKRSVESGDGKAGRKTNGN